MTGSGNVLAEQSIVFTTEGMPGVDRAVDGLKGRLDKVAESNKKAQAAAKGFTGAMTQGVAGVAQRIGGLVRSFSVGGGLGLGGALSVGGIAAGALRGTVEAERLGRAIEYFTRVLGDELAPAVRAVTDGIVQAAHWYRSLDKGTRQAVAGVALLATGITVVATVVASITAVVGAIGAIPLAVGGAVAAIVVFSAIVVEATVGIRTATTILGVFFDTMLRGVERLLAAAKPFVGGLIGAVFGGGAGNAARGVMDRAGGAADRVAARIQAMFKGLAGDGGGFNRRFPAAFEQGQQTWQRLMQSFAERDTALADPAKQAVAEHKKANQKLDSIDAQLVAMNRALGRLQFVQ